MSTRLPVRSCRILGEGDDVDTRHVVPCPRQERTVDFARCCGCALRDAVHVAKDGQHGAIECRAPQITRVPNGRVDVAEQAVRVRLGDVLADEITCLRPELGMAEAEEAFTREKIRAAPVVDAEGRLVGIVSRSDFRRGPGTVADVMTPLVHGLPEEAPIAYAVSLMGLEGIHEVPVVDAEGRVVGMITATDALRWVARALGYVTGAAASATG